MIVAIIKNEKVLSINNYPNLQNVDDLKNNFTHDYNFINVTNYDLSDYDLDNGDLYYNGTDFYYEEIPVSELTENEIIQAELLLNQIDIIAKQNEHDEVLAEILLNQMGV